MDKPKYNLMTKKDLDIYLNSLEKAKLNFYHNPGEKEKLNAMQEEAIIEWHRQGDRCPNCEKILTKHFRETKHDTVVFVTCTCGYKDTDI